MHHSSSMVRNRKEIDRSSGPGLQGQGSCGSGTFFGLDTENLSPGAQVAAALAVLILVVLSGIFLLAAAPGLWWILTTYGWVAFPASGLLMRGLAGTAAEPSGKQKSLAAAGAQEKELLGALAARGELSPVQAAIETSLSVAEADKMLKELTGGGYLEVRVRGGGIYYALWESEKVGSAERLEGSRAKHR